MKTGLILEGGAVRGIFTAGVLDRLMEDEIYFPYVVGVSAGGGNAMSYVSRQKGRTADMINVSEPYS
ncbi:MAG: patatin-like phospholipase family protein, partial [Oscillospiraceae bacterium]|nr:patatin-like phospholipase family protein [Oscillospiraceae bacterium]